MATLIEDGSMKRGNVIGTALLKLDKDVLKRLYPPAPTVFIGPPPSAVRWDNVTVRRIDGEAR